MFTMVILIEIKLLEDIRVRRKADQRAVRLIACSLFLAYQLTQLEFGLYKFPVPVAPDKKVGGERIHGLGSHAVQADAELEHIVVVLSPGVDLRDAVDDLAERNAASVVADRDHVVLNRHINAVTVMSVQSLTNLAELLPEWCAAQLESTPLVTPAGRVLKEALERYPASRPILAAGPGADDMVQAIIALQGTDPGIAP